MFSVLSMLILLINYFRNKVFVMFIPRKLVEFCVIMNITAAIVFDVIQTSSSYMQCLDAINPLYSTSKSIQFLRNV